MITLFKKVPKEKILETITKKYPNHEIVRFNGFDGDVTEITYALSAGDLFGNQRLVFLSEVDRELWGDVITALKGISNGVTVFWAEDSFPVALTKGMPKHETVDMPAQTGEKESKSSPFQIANELSSGNGITIWATYQQLIIDGHAPEAIFGIVWWKLKDIAKRKLIVSSVFKKTLHQFLATYGRARETGGELQVGLEEILLTFSKEQL